mmetsp:Transcript_1761/g.3308  ORF Transcript_1761/g.3308 Transcript_1761/m.3308 type:complete len:112 (+) Transcript_1761:329-664(+)
MADRKMADPTKFAIVNVSRDEVTPAAVPDSDAEAHIMKSTKNHSLPKLNISFSLVDPSVRKNVQKKLRNSMDKHINTGPAHNMNPLEHASYTFKHVLSQFSGKTSSCHPPE